MSRDQPQLAEDGVPVVIAVDEHGIVRLDLRQGGQDQCAMKDETASMLPSPGGLVEAGGWIDDMDYGPCSRANVSSRSVVSPLRAPISTTVRALIAASIGSMT